LLAKETNKKKQRINNKLTNRIKNKQKQKKRKTMPHAPRKNGTRVHHPNKKRNKKI